MSKNAEKTEEAREIQAENNPGPREYGRITHRGVPDRY